VPLVGGLGAPIGAGLYRLRDGEGELVYLGEGLIRARLAVHLDAARRGAGSRASAFREHQPLECSWAVGDWAPHQRLELECDLIAAAILKQCAVPAAQFIGASA
jgi:hypothetical protein